MTKSSERTLRRRRQQAVGRKDTKFCRLRREYIPHAPELSGLLPVSQYPLFCLLCLPLHGLMSRFWA